MPEAALDLATERELERIVVGREELTPIPPRPTPRVHIRPRSQSGRRSAIFSRTRDIVAANMTDLLGEAEDPAKMSRLIIVEMEETLIDIRASTARRADERREGKDGGVTCRLRRAPYQLQKKQNRNDNVE